MKFFETHFDEYINANKIANLHPKLDKIFKRFPKQINDLKNLIYYGPSGVGKYTQVLKSIKQYSPSELKYEKKISITHNKQTYFFKISDIHYEIDISLLGCNSKLLWHDIYIQLIDIISTKPEKTGIVLCKNFHHIHSELLENFYSYMQQNTLCSVNLKFILLTEEISFIPDNILNCCEVINIPRPTKAMYNKCLYPICITSPLENIINIKNVRSNICELIHQPYKIICDKIVEVMINVDDLKFLKFRDLLYDIFIYNLNINDCIWYIISTLTHKNKLHEKDLEKVMIKTYTFFQYYNNNYRPIYHLENYILYLISVIHEF